MALDLAKAVDRLLAVRAELKDNHGNLSEALRNVYGGQVRANTPSNFAAYDGDQQGLVEFCLARPDVVGKPRDADEDVTVGFLESGGFQHTKTDGGSLTMLTENGKLIRVRLVNMTWSYGRELLPDVKTKGDARALFRLLKAKWRERR